MTDAGTRQNRTYGGWQAERVAFIFSLSGRRAAMLAAAVLAVVVFTRFGGRTVDEWAVSAASHGMVRLRAQHRFAGGPFAPAPRPDGPELDLPGILAPLRFVSAPAARGRDLALVQHPHDHTWTAVARIACPGIT